MRAWIALLLATLALAGCAEETAKPVENADEGAFDELNAEVTEDTGLIRGLVLDPAIVPIAGVTVTIQGLGTQAVTNDDGAFLFGDLDAGTYFLEVTKLGHKTMQQGATVVAGEARPEILKIQMLPDESTAPMVETFPYDGFLQCSFSLVAVGFNACGVPEIFGMPLDNPLVVHEVAANGTWAQVDMTWKSTQSLGDRLNLMMSWGNCGGFFCDVETAGVSPITVAVDAEQLKTMLEDPADSSRPGLMVRVFGTAASATEAANLGATIDQGFNHYTSVFYNFLPDEGWTFIEDGAHEIPQ